MQASVRKRTLVLDINETSGEIQGLDIFAFSA